MTALTNKPLASIEKVGGGKCVVTVTHNGNSKDFTISETQALMMKNLIDQHPDWGVYEAFQYTNTDEFKQKLLGDLLGDLKSDLLKDHPGYSN